MPTVRRGLSTMLDTTLAIGIPSMADTGNIHYSCAVVDSVDNPVSSDADSPQIFCPFELSASGWTRIVCKRYDSFQDPRCQRIVQSFEFPPC